MRSLLSFTSIGALLALGIVLSAIWAERSRVAGLILLMSSILLVAVRYDDLLQPILKPRLVDLAIVRDAGAAALQGENPYGIVGFLYPPSAIPLSEALAAVPASTGDLLAALLNLLGGFSLVPLAYFALRSSGCEPRPLRGGVRTILGLTIMVALSDAAVRCYNLGQSSIFVASLILLALLLMARTRMLGSGLAFALATLKVHTVVPFLLIWPRFGSRRLWLSFAGSIALLVLLGTRPDQVESRVRLMLQNIVTNAQPGAVNDITEHGRQTSSIIGVDHVVYRLGLRSIREAKAIGLATVALLGASIALIAQRWKLPWSYTVALISIYSMLFLYHRHYDLVLMAWPLTLCVLEAQRTEGRLKWVFVSCAMGLAAAMNVSDRFLTEITARWSSLSWFARAFVTPYPTWILLIVLVLLTVAACAVVRRDEALAPTS